MLHSHISSLRSKFLLCDKKKIFHCDQESEIETLKFGLAQGLKCLQLLYMDMLMIKVQSGAMTMFFSDLLGFLFFSLAPLYALSVSVCLLEIYSRS